MAGRLTYLVQSRIGWRRCGCRRIRRCCVAPLRAGRSPGSSDHRRNRGRDFGHRTYGTVFRLSRGSAVGRGCPRPSSRCHRVGPVLRTGGRSARARLPRYLAMDPSSVLRAALGGSAVVSLYQEQRRLATDLGEANAQLRAANLSFAKGLIATLDARDQYTAGHSAAVAIYARDIAERMQLGAEQVELAHLCGFVHDIGKIGLPAGLLEKPGALTLDERREMQRHSEIGERILANVDSYAEIAGSCGIITSASTARGTRQAVRRGDPNRSQESSPSLTPTTR